MSIEPIIKILKLLTSFRMLQICHGNTSCINGWIHLLSNSRVDSIFDTCLNRCTQQKFKN